LSGNQFPPISTSEYPSLIIIVWQSGEIPSDRYRTALHARRTITTIGHTLACSSQISKLDTATSDGRLRLHGVCSQWTREKEIYIYRTNRVIQTARGSPIRCQSGEYRCPVGPATPICRQVDVSVPASPYILALRPTLRVSSVSPVRSIL